MEEPEDAIQLIQTNAAINIRNNTYLDQLKFSGAEEAYKTAVDQINSKGSAGEKEKVKMIARELNNDASRGMPYKLRLTVGSKYMVTHNVDVSGNLKVI